MTDIGVAGVVKLLRVVERDGGIQHAIREAPLIVVPRANLDERALHDLGQTGVVSRGCRVMIEVD